MAYVALYRRWRPQDFDTLVGQQAVKTALTNALTSGRIAHAYLFAGPRGTGKTSTARILARALNCEQGPTAHPCGTCSNCQRIADGTSMDVFEIDAASNRGIDEIKALREQLAFAPVNGRYKVYIIDEVHMLTTESFNALLKTLEEPPAHVIFILATTDPQKIPATIHSRCQRFDFRRVTVDEITDHLAMVAEGSDISADREALRLIAIQSEGGMRDALSLLDQCGVMTKHISVETVQEVLGIVGRTALRQLVEAIGRQDLSTALAKLTYLLEQGKDVSQVLVELAEYLRALLLFKAAPSYEEVYLTDNKEALSELAPLYGKERIMAAEERLHSAIYELKGTMRPRITAELCLFDLCRMEGSTIAALQARIEQLEQRIASGSFAALPKNEQPAVQAHTYAAKEAVTQPYEIVNTSAPQAVKQSVTQEASGVAAKNIPSDKICDFDFPDSMYEDEGQYLSADELTMATAKPPATKQETPVAPSSVAQTRNEAPPAASAAQPKPQAKPAAPQMKPAVRPAAASSATVEYGGDWAQGEEYWKKALEILKGEKKLSIVSCAKNGRAVSFENGLLKVAFKAEFMCTRMNKDDYRSVLENILLRLSRQEIRLECISEAQLAGAAPQRTAKASTPSVVQKEPELQTGQLPDNVRKAMDVFGGSVRELK